MNVQSWGGAVTLIDLANADTYGSGASTESGVDISGLTGQILIVLSTTNAAGSSPTLDVKIQESADNSTWSDITGAAFDQVTTSNDDDQFSLTISADAASQYIRAHLTVGGTSTPTFEASVTGIGFDKYPS